MIAVIDPDGCSYAFCEVMSGAGKDAYRDRVCSS